MKLLLVSNLNDFWLFYSYPPCAERASSPTYCSIPVLSIRHIVVSWYGDTCAHSEGETTLSVSKCYHEWKGFSILHGKRGFFGVVH